MVQVFVYDSVADLPDYLPEELNVLIRKKGESGKKVLERAKPFFHPSITPAILQQVYMSGGGLCGPPADYVPDPIMHEMISWRTPLTYMYVIGDVCRSDEFGRQELEWRVDASMIRKVEPSKHTPTHELVVQPSFKYVSTPPVMTLPDPKEWRDFHARLVDITKTPIEDLNPTKDE